MAIGNFGSAAAADPASAITGILILAQIRVRIIIQTGN
jgi:hypothetical protein